jgi:hypothetical protein
MEFSVGDHGFLRSPNLHDGFVDGVLLTGDESATVMMRDVTGQTFSMQLIGIKALVCDDFRQGNIILSI